MRQNKDYFAFISYKSEDVEWATWLQHELEHYHLPASFNGRTDVPQELRPIFRDIDELSAGNLPDQIKQALFHSQNLIVICSPQAAESPWVNQEVETFVSLGRTEHIYPFIVEGNSPSEFFPPALRNLPKDEERLGGDVSKKGRDAAFVKVVAGMLGVGFDSLWNRYEKEKAEEERKQREQRDKLMISQSRFLAEKANSLVEEGDSYTARLLALEALPENLQEPNRPYTTKAERALRKATSYETAILRGHENHVNGATFSTDGKYILSASSDKTIKIWDAASGMMLQSLHSEYGDMYNFAALSFDNQHVKGMLAIANMGSAWSIDGDIPNGIYRRETVAADIAAIKKPNGELCYIDVSANSDLQNLIRHLCPNQISISMDEQFIATVSADKESIQIWDVKDNFRFRTLFSESSVSSDIRSLSFSFDGKLLVSAGYDICLWQLEDGKPYLSKYYSRFGIESLPYSVAFSPDNRYILLGTSDGPIVMSEVESLDVIRIFSGHTQWCKTAFFSSDNKRIASASEDHTVRIWETEENTPTLQFQMPETHINTKAIAYSTDGQCISLEGGDYTLEMRDALDFRLIHSFKGLDDTINGIAFSPNGKYIAACTGHETLLWNIETEEMLHRFSSDYSVNGISISSDNKWIICVANRSIKIYEIDSGIEICSEKTFNKINSVSFIPFSKHFLVSVESEVHLWKKYSELHTISSDYGWYNSDNVRASDCKTEEYWAKGSVWMYQSLKGHVDWIWKMAVSPSGGLIASASEDTTIKLWDVKTKECIKTINGHNKAVKTIEFSSDEKVLLSASEDNTIRVWDVETGTELHCIQTEKTYDYELIAATFSPDYRTIATIAIMAEPINGGNELIFRTWQFPRLQELIDQTRKRFHNRQLSVNERDKFNLDF